MKSSTRSPETGGLCLPARVCAALACLLIASAAWAAAPSAAGATATRAYVVGTYDGSTLRLFLDGRQVAQHGISVVPGTPKAVEIGSFLAGEVWNGIIDDVALYGRALSAQTIQTHFRVGTGRARGDYAPLVRRGPALVSYWRLDDRTLGKMTDATGRNPGEYRRGSRLGVPGLISRDPDRAASLDGSVGGMQITRMSGFSPRAGFTLEAWVKARDNRDATIVTTLGSGFLKTQPQGHWGFGVISGQHIESVYSRERASTVTAPPPKPPPGQAPGAPASAPAPSSGSGGGGGLGVWIIPIGLVLLVGLALAVRELIRPPADPELTADDEEPA